MTCYSICDVVAGKLIGHAVLLLEQQPDMISMLPKALFSAHPLLDRMLNPAHESNQSISDWAKHGSRRHFQTDMHINGEYFRSRTDNQYFCVVDNNTNVGEISEFMGDFRPLHCLTRDYHPDTHRILRLEFTKYKEYFVESYQAITIKNPDVTVMNMPLEELLLMTPKFEPLRDR